MAEEKVEVSVDGLSLLQSAVREFARPEIDRIMHVIIEALRSRPAEGVFGHVHARHLWDEYCWALQEGPFDTNFGSISDGFAGVVQAHIEAEVEKLPEHTRVFLSALAFEEDDDFDEEEWLGSLWVEGIVKVVTNAMNERASQRSLYLIGPDRADAIGHEILGTGFVWSMLDRAEATDLVRGHVDAMIDPDADLSLLADEMVEAYLATVRADDDGGFFPEFIGHFDEKLRWMIMEQDVLPSLEEMRAKLLKAWDG